MKPLPAEDLDHILDRTRSLWDQVRGRRVFVSGGTGFLGAWLLESFSHCNRTLKLDANLSVLTRDPSAFALKFPHLVDQPSIEVLQGDIRDFAFPGYEFDYIVHGAASTSAEAAARPRELLGTLIQGTDRMLEFAQERNVQGFLFVSSGAVYGRQPEAMSHIPENHLGGPAWTTPNAAYAEGKRAAELTCSIAASESGLRVAIARCFAFVGPHLPLDQHFAIGNFIGDALAGRNLAVRSDGTPMRSYLYASDLAIWLWTLLFRGTQQDENPFVANVGSGDAVSIRDLAQLVVNELDPSLRVQIAWEPVAGCRREQYVPDVRKAERCLGLRPAIGLGEAIRRTAGWCRSAA